MTHTWKIYIMSLFEHGSDIPGCVIRPLHAVDKRRRFSRRPTARPLSQANKFEEIWGEVPSEQVWTCLGGPKWTNLNRSMCGVVTRGLPCGQTDKENDWQTDMTENIAYLQLRWRAVKMEYLLAINTHTKILVETGKNHLHYYTGSLYVSQELREGCFSN